MNKMYDVAMLSDFYESTMANGAILKGHKDTIAYFDMFFRRVPDDGGFAIMAGLEQLINDLKNFTFTDEDIEYMREQKIFDEKFLKYLKDFRFSCDVWAIPEGTPIFPKEPIITVRGPITELFLIETLLLLNINHQSLIATKANRIVRAAQGRPVMEFGARRAHGMDASVYGARAAYIGGCVGTSCVKAGRDFDIPVSGTMAHSWVQLFDTELEAFCAYAREYPDNCVLLVDTYNALKSGVPNAIEAFKRELLPRGYRPKGIRFDSGDIAYLSRKARKMLDEAGFEDCTIVASNSLDEYLIRDMIGQGAKVDSFGVGERLITSSSSPVLGGVYKLCAVEKDGKICPRIKISDNVAKISTPCFKKPWRLFDRETGKAIADLVTLNNEVIDDTKPYELFDPDFTWKRKIVENYVAKPLTVQLFKGGECVYECPPLDEVKKHCAEQIDTLWDEVLRFDNPHNYYVDLSQKLWDEKQRLLAEHGKKDEQ